MPASGAWISSFSYVVLGALHRDLLAVALQFEDAERGGLGLLAKRDRLLEAGEVSAGARGPGFASCGRSG